MPIAIPVSRHHTARTQRVPGVWEVARPLRDTSWWHQWRREWACKKATGHCWHPEHGRFIEWWCCMCSGETDGVPDQKCVYCKEPSDA